MSQLVWFKRKSGGNLDLEEIKQQAERSWLGCQMMPTEVTVALVDRIERLQREIKQLKTREFILVTALESIRAISISRVDDVLIVFIEHMLTLEPNYEKD